jgi:hypothetical protein
MMWPSAHRLTPRRARFQDAGRHLELGQLPNLVVGFYLSLWSWRDRHLR